MQIRKNWRPTLRETKSIIFKLSFFFLNLIYVYKFSENIMVQNRFANIRPLFLRIFHLVSPGFCFVLRIYIILYCE